LHDRDRDVVTGGVERRLGLADVVLLRSPVVEDLVGAQPFLVAAFAELEREK
jgi:hypothetical protein